jgi:hypothetical protein
MRLTALWLMCSLCFGEDLEALRREHRWFDLREALKTQKGSALDRGAAAAAFQEVREAEHLLRTSPDDAARDPLFAMFMRNGLYQKAAAALQAGNKIALGDRERIDTLAQLGDQSVVSHTPSRIQGQIRESELFAPISINGQRVKAQLDTDANMSLMSQSEAQRLGLKIAGTVTTRGASEQKGRGKVGTAAHFEIGALRLRNVAFGIVSDEEQPFKDLPPGERVVLGIPVILAMGDLRWSHDGTIEIGKRAAGRGEPNLCFDQSDPVVRVESQGKSLEMLFDTGSNETFLWPRFLRDFPGVAAAAKKDSNTITGITGSTEVETLDLGEIKLRVRGADVFVRPARVLTKSAMRPSEWVHGWLGFDSMERGGAVDFRAMIVTIE